MREGGGGGEEGILQRHGYEYNWFITLVILCFTLQLYTKVDKKIS